MATSHNKSATSSSVLFTLPLSCQICLGKVKQPALCSNYHVFCGTCINTWLERSHHCPSCRVPIDHSNPVKHIRGGLNQVEDEEETKSTPEMRKTRFDLLYREYEDTLAQLEREVKNLKLENSLLKSQIGSAQSIGASSSSIKQGGSSDQQLQLLTSKLQDAQKLYDRVQRDIKKLKQENNALKERNSNLTRENGMLREEISSRSPQKFGRVTVATLESQLESQKKEIQRLTKALERSDLYIEDLEQQLQTKTTHGEARGRAATVHTDTQPLSKDYSGAPLFKDDKEDRLDVLSSRLDLHSGPERGDKGQSHQVKRQLFAPQPHVERENQTSSTGAHYVQTNTISSVDSGKDLGYGISKSKAKTESIMKKSGNGLTNAFSDSEEMPAKKVQFKLNDKKSNDTSSFNLEAPSPIMPSSFSRLSLESGLSSDLSNDHIQKSNKKPESSSREDLDFGYATQDVPTRDQRGVTSRETHNPRVSLPATSTSHDDNSISHPGVRKKRTSDGQKKNSSFDLEGPSLDDTQTIRTELNDLDISMTPELSDCLKLLNRAEKKMHTSEVPLSKPQTRLPSWVPEMGLDHQTGPTTSGKDSAHGAGSYKPLSLGGPETGKGSTHSYPGLLSEKLQGTSGTMSSWEHGFFSSLKVNPYKHTSSVTQLPAASSTRDLLLGSSAQSHSSYSGVSAAQATSAGSSQMLLSSHEDFKRPLSRQTSCPDQPSLSAPLHSRASTFSGLTPHDPSVTSALPGPLQTLTSSDAGRFEPLSSITSLSSFAVTSSSAACSSTGPQTVLPSTSGVSQLGVDFVPSHLPAGRRSVPTSDYLGSAGQGDWISRTKSSIARKDYSYISNMSSVGGDGTDSNNMDSFLPEPKKRLFDSTDDLDISSPTKTTKIV